MRETQVQSLGQEDPLEKETVTHSSTLALKNSMDGGAWWATVMGLQKSQTWFSGPPGSPIPGILQARTLEWVAISFSNQKLLLGM